jgi:antitoxin component of MazEF toxin-antitoxin module
MGNSLAIRVPKRVAEEAGLWEKDAVEIEVRRGRSSCSRICGEFIDWKTC